MGPLKIKDPREGKKQEWLMIFLEQHEDMSGSGGSDYVIRAINKEGEEIKFENKTRFYFSGMISMKFLSFVVSDHCFLMRLVDNKLVDISASSSDKNLLHLSTSKIPYDINHPVWVAENIFVDIFFDNDDYSFNIYQLDFSQYNEKK